MGSMNADSRTGKVPNARTKYTARAPCKPRAKKLIVPLNTHKHYTHCKRIKLTLKAESRNTKYRKQIQSYELLAERAKCSELIKLTTVFAKKCDDLMILFTCNSQSVETDTFPNHNDNMNNRP